MDSLSHSEVTVMLLALAVLLTTARLFGEIAKRFRQPSVLGEILAGILLGPTVLGHLWPGANLFLFPPTGPNAIALSGLTTLAVVLFLLVAGMEVDLSTLFRLRRVALVIGVTSMVVPFTLGFGLGQVVPNFLGMEPGADRLIFSLFFGIAMSICALPVIAKTLMDLNLYRSDVGMSVVAVAIFHDIVGWIIFAMILGMMSPDAKPGGGGIYMTIALTIGFAAFMLTIGRWGINKSLPWLQAHTGWPGGVLGFALALGLFGAAATEWIGIHAIFGAFIVGVALGDSEHLRQQTRTTIDQFISFIFAPLFFASIGLRVDFIAHFDWMLVLTVLVIACVGETAGAVVGARWCGFPKRESWALGFALNARGAMEIVLALLALQYGIIGDRLFVALVVMALVTSLIAGPLMQAVLRQIKRRDLKDFLTDRHVIIDPVARTVESMIGELASRASAVTKLPAGLIHDQVMTRERIMHTGLPGGIAVPHARLRELSKPYVLIAVHQSGIDFDAPDGQPARFICLLLTPADEAEWQIMLLDLVARTLTPPLRRQLLRCKTPTEFHAVLNQAASESRHHEAAHRTSEA